MSCPPDYPVLNCFEYCIQAKDEGCAQIYDNLAKNGCKKPMYLSDCLAPGNATLAGTYIPSVPADFTRNVMCDVLTAVVPLVGPWSVAIFADTALALTYLIALGYEGAQEWRNNKNIQEFTEENKHKEVLESDPQSLNGISKEIFLLAKKIHTLNNIIIVSSEEDAVDITPNEQTESISSVFEHKKNWFTWLKDAIMLKKHH